MPSGAVRHAASRLIAAAGKFRLFHAFTGEFHMLGVRPPVRQESPATLMRVLDTHINPSDETFVSNRAHMQQLVGELRARLARIREGGGEKYLERHRSQGK